MDNRPPTSNSASFKVITTFVVILIILVIVFSRYKRLARSLLTPRKIIFGEWSLEVELCYLRLQTQSLNAILQQYVIPDGRRNSSGNISVRSYIWPIWFNLGTLITILLVFPSIFVLISNLSSSAFISNYGVSAANIPSNVVTESAKPQTSYSQRFSFQVMLPGVTLPVAEVGYYIIALMVCSVVHEAGHAIAAIQEGVPLLHCGIMLVLWFLPVAFVSLSTAELEGLGAWRRLRIFTAGVWHNLVLAGTAYFLLIFVVPIFFTPLFQIGTGVMVMDITSNSPALGESGLTIGNVVYEINGCKVMSRSDWRSCIIQNMLSSSTSKKEIGWCMEFEENFVLDRLNIAASKNNSLNEDCCITGTESDGKESDPNNICFSTISDTSSNNDMIRFSACIAARKYLDNSTSYCFSYSDPSKSTILSSLTTRSVCSNTDKSNSATNPKYCMKPFFGIGESQRLIQVKRKDSKNNKALPGRLKDFLFIGNPAEIYDDVTVSNYIPRYWAVQDGTINWTSWSLQLMSRIPDMTERGLFYVVAFSSALAVLNAVPCFKLDGQHVIKALIVDLEIPFLTEKLHLFGNRAKINRFRKSVANTLTIFGTIILILNVIFACIKAFGFNS